LPRSLACEAYSATGMMTTLGLGRVRTHERYWQPTVVAGGSSCDWRQANGDAVQNRLPDNRLNIAVIGPVIDRHTGPLACNPLPRRAVAMPPTMRQADDARRHLLAHAHRNRSAVYPALQDGNLAVAHTSTFRIKWMDKKHAALLTGCEDGHVVHPGVVGA